MDTRFPKMVEFVEVVCQGAQSNVAEFNRRLFVLEHLASQVQNKIALKPICNDARLITDEFLLESLVPLLE